jgi:uncharacterized protein (DUF362 family)
LVLAAVTGVISRLYFLGDGNRMLCQLAQEPQHAERYYHELDQILAAGLRLFPINVRDKTVVLKPNLVDYTPGDAINTHPILVLAAAESFRCLGAKYVIVAEGPGHQRDTQLVLSQTGYQQSLREERIRFIDLNRDQLIRTHCVRITRE